MKVELKLNEDGFTCKTFGVTGDSAKDYSEGALVLLDKDQWLKLGSPREIVVEIERKL